MSVSGIRKDCYKITVTVPADITVPAGTCQDVISSIKNYLPDNTLPIAVAHYMNHVNSHQLELIFYPSKWYSDYHIMVFNGGSNDFIIPKDTTLFVLCA